MFKRLLVSLIVLMFLSAKPALAQETTCTQVYGGGVVCGAVAPEHKPVETGIADNLVLAGGAFVLASGILLFLSKRTGQSSAS